MGSGSSCSTITITTGWASVTWATSTASPTTRCATSWIYTRRRMAWLISTKECTPTWTIQFCKSRKRNRRVSRPLKAILAMVVSRPSHSTQTPSFVGSTSMTSQKRSESWRSSQLIATPRTHHWSRSSKRLAKSRITNGDYRKICAIRNTWSDAMWTFLVDHFTVWRTLTSARLSASTSCHSASAAGRPRWVSFLAHGNRASQASRRKTLKSSLKSSSETITERILKINWFDRIFL